MQLHQRLEAGFRGAARGGGVSAAHRPYIADNMRNSDFILPEGEKKDDHRDQAEFFNEVGNSFFKTIGIPMLSGRRLAGGIRRTSQKVSVINQSLAKKRFPNENPIGKMVKIGFDDQRTRQGLWAFAATRFTQA